MKAKRQHNGPGRPSDPKALSFNSMAAAAAHIGGDCTVDLLKAAKKAGCPAFRQSRIYVAELAEWLKENPIDPTAIQTKESLQIRKLAGECRRIEREEKIEEGRLVAIEEVAAINAKVDAHIVQAAREIFTNDAFMQNLMGCGSFAEMKARHMDMVDAFLAEINMPNAHP